MIKKVVCISLAAMTLLICGTLALSSAASAQTASPKETGQALEIAPPVITLRADPGKTIKTQISLRDITDAKLVVRSDINDFAAAGEDGTPKILLEGNEDNPYSLKSWISPIPELSLEPRQIKKLPVTINIPANASPGGYYGIVRFTASAPELDDTGVALSMSLGAMLFVQVNGDAKEELSIEEFKIGRLDESKKEGEQFVANSFFESAPVYFQQRIKNTGNIYQQPSGKVEITDMFNKPVASVNINLPPRNILPGSIRRFEQPLDAGVIGDRQLFGKYTATLKVNYGADKQTITSTLTFWVIPYKIIIGAIILLVAGFFLFRYLIRKHNDRVVRRALRNHRSRRR